uniref:Uncharacterized protein n=1 Tax=Lepeophtheirus salmonis TaxID=72036 RepID=A0A0K2UIW3_LEPSM
MCRDHLQTSIPHPQESSKRVNLLVHAVYIFKYIYNCFQRRKNLICPNIYLAGSPSLRLYFYDSKEIHMLESNFKVKQAHKLSLKTLNPTSIENTNIPLADAIFQ